MRTERSRDPSPIQVVEALRSIDRTLSDDVEAYVASARSLEMMALDLAQRNTQDDAAIAALIYAAEGDVRVMRRAHRHIELALSEQWPAGLTLIRAFDYLSAGRQKLESNGSDDRNVFVQPKVAGTTTRPSRQPVIVYDDVDEASMESFPASDAPSFWGR